jgi:hypothetical protein
VRTNVWFSIWFLHVMVSISFHYENRAKNWVENWMTIWKFPNTRNNLLQRRGKNAPPYKNTTIKCNSCSRRICYNFVTCMLYLLLKSKDVQIKFKPKEKQNIIKHTCFKVKVFWNWFQCVGISIKRFFLATPNHLPIKKGGISLLHIIMEACNKFTQFE